ncbi:hypothetical protein KIMH_00690 [Bombiscardovia apis]|uniref:Sortase n=1 Tax=Bombiscardovia apis TaxID=2932182 RepID=A0ABN6SFD0_9BIFI|nr:class C sortase [Bombiscardovia apis]BDR53958.1 hypothetical protein KIMH_00690 [Bombiscardovia apis]
MARHASDGVSEPKHALNEPKASSPSHQAQPQNPQTPGQSKPSKPKHSAPAAQDENNKVGKKHAASGRKKKGITRDSAERKHKKTSARSRKNAGKTYDVTGAASAVAPASQPIQSSPISEPTAFPSAYSSPAGSEPTATGASTPAVTPAVSSAPTVAAHQEAHAAVRQTAQAKNKTKRKAGSHRGGPATKMDWSVLIAVILVCMFTLGYVLFSGSLVAQNHNSHESVRSANDYDEAVSKLSESTVKKTLADITEYDEHMRSGGALDPFASEPADAKASESVKTTDYTEILKRVSPDMVGYLSVPKADFSGPIYYGDVNASLTRGVGYLPNTALPSQVKGTRSVLFGHTGLDNLHVFDDLDKVHKGDEFSVRMLNTTYNYKVFGIEVVRPDQVDVLRPQKDKTIVTLLTCTPKGVNDHRLLVSGELVSVTTDKPELQQTRSPSMLAVTIIPLAACVVGAAYVWLRKQQVSSTARTRARRGKTRAKERHE